MFPSSQNYPGNKSTNGSFQNIINHFPPHVDFISACGGSGAVEFRKKLAPGKNIAYELSTNTINKFWQWPHGYTVINADCVKSIFASGLAKKATTLVYWDVPYLHSARSTGKLYYEHEWHDKQHERYLLKVRNSPALHAISHYRCELYDDLLKGWHVHEWPVMTHSGPRLEALYMNYPKPKQLHQYNFLGVDFIDRQRIKRKKDKFLNKLKNLPEAERYALIAALNEYLQHR